MSRWIRMAGMICLLAELDAMPAAAADHGRIVFAGAVVLPTCGPEDVGEPQAARAGRWYRWRTRADRARWRRCRSRGAASTVDPTAYRTWQVTLGPSQAIHFRAVWWQLREMTGLRRVTLRVRIRDYR